MGNECQGRQRLGISPESFAFMGMRTCKHRVRVTYGYRLVSPGRQTSFGLLNPGCTPANDGRYRLDRNNYQKRSGFLLFWPRNLHTVVLRHGGSLCQIPSGRLAAPRSFRGFYGRGARPRRKPVSIASAEPVNPPDLPFRQPLLTSPPNGT